MIKREPTYKIRKSSALLFTDITIKYLDKKFPNTKKCVEKAVIKEWKKFLGDRGVKVSYAISEAPDFVVTINGEEKGVELCRLTSKIEEKNQATSSECQVPFFETTLSKARFVYSNRN